jgi:hypothetical protein
MISHAYELTTFISYAAMPRPLAQLRSRYAFYTHAQFSQSQDWQLVEGDPDSVAFVAVSPLSPPDSAEAEDHVSYEEPGVDEEDFFRNDGIWPISFKKPADANQRFRRLLRDWHLAPLKVGDGTIGIARDTNPDRERTYKRIDADNVKPRWHLFTNVQCELVQAGP